MTLYKKPFENIVGKGENAGNQHFLLFPPCFFCSSQNKFQFHFVVCKCFLAHLSTTCSRGAIVTGHRPASVRPSVRPSVNNFFKNLLLQNQKANLDKTWQECSLGEALQKLLKEFNSN